MHMLRKKVKKALIIAVPLIIAAAGIFIINHRPWKYAYVDTPYSLYDNNDISQYSEQLLRNPLLDKEEFIQNVSAVHKWKNHVFYMLTDNDKTTVYDYNDTNNRTSVVYKCKSRTETVEFLNNRIYERYNDNEYPVNFFSSAGKLYIVNQTGIIVYNGHSESELVYSSSFNASYANGYLYYTDEHDYQIYEYNTASRETRIINKIFSYNVSAVADGFTFNNIADNNYIYFYSRINDKIYKIYDGLAASVDMTDADFVITDYDGNVTQIAINEIIQY